MDRLKALEIFKAVADRGSFVRAASALDLSCAVVTRSVQELESLLGLRLLHRTTRRVSLTCDGEDVLHRAAGLLDTFADLASLGRVRDAEVAGRMHVLAPAALGPRCLAAVAQDVAQAGRVQHRADGQAVGVPRREELADAPRPRRGC